MLVVVTKDSREDQLGVVNSLMTYANVADIDPQPPNVKLKTLGYDICMFF